MSVVLMLPSFYLLFLGIYSALLYPFLLIIFFKISMIIVGKEAGEAKIGYKTFLTSFKVKINRRKIERRELS
ncbi:MAG TPA: hypothetical protein ENL42_00695 [Thermoplasmatales archaeon]|nr:hypothetical protein [Thermoplasmatales archaeon]